MDFASQEDVRLRADALGNAAHEGPDAGRRHEHRHFTLGRSGFEFLAGLVMI
jgi:hypothetical protein